MTTLKKLSVSLTKHGAHKLATLLQHYDRTEILNHLSGSISGVNIERAQAKKNLSVYSGNAVPPLWDEVRLKSQDAINGLVLIAIIFSHHRLLGALASGSDGEGTYTGKIVSGVQFANNKEFTNFAHTLEELGASTEHTSDFVTYDFRPLFLVQGLNELAAKLITLKLRRAGWDEKNTLANELERLALHKAFSVTSDQMTEWITGTTGADIPVSENDQETEIDDDVVKDVVFQSGYSETKQGTTSRKDSKSGTVRLRHNELQKKLYEQLREKFGVENVGTEIGTGYGTSVDAVVQVGGERWFYEIKTAASAKACIREGLSQVLEYAYWSGKPQAQKLIIISPNPETSGAKRYLEYLRDSFNLPIYYEQMT